MRAMSGIEVGIIVSLQHSEPMSRLLLSAKVVLNNSRFFIFLDSTKPGRYLERFNNYCTKAKVEYPKTANDTAAKGQKPAWMATINSKD